MYNTFAQSFPTANSGHQQQQAATFPPNPPSSSHQQQNIMNNNFSSTDSFVTNLAGSPSQFNQPPTNFLNQDNTGSGSHVIVNNQFSAGHNTLQTNSLAGNLLPMGFSNTQNQQATISPQPNITPLPVSMPNNDNSVGSPHHAQSNVNTPTDNDFNFERPRKKRCIDPYNNNSNNNNNTNINSNNHNNNNNNNNNNKHVVKRQHAHTIPTPQQTSGINTNVNLNKKQDFNLNELNCIASKVRLSAVLECQEYLRQASEEKCAVCSSTQVDNLRFCAGCSVFRYCSVECQKKDWEQHKFFCEPLNMLYKKLIPLRNRSVKQK